MKKIALFFFVFLSVSCFAQFSKTHYIPPLTAQTNLAEDQYLYISTPNTNNVNVKIIEIGGAVINGIVSNTSPLVYFVGQGDASQLFTSKINIGIITNKGYIVEAEDLVYVSVRVNAARNTNGSYNHAGGLVSKGNSALGTIFRLGAMLNPNVDSSLLNFASILATENNTSVTVSNIPLGTVFSNGTIYSAPIVVTLKKNESYVLALENIAGNNSPSNSSKIIGALVETNKPVVVNSGSFGGSNSTGNGRDVGFDQIVSFDKTGKEYIFVKGIGTNDIERVLLIAQNPNTSIFLNGSSTAFTTLVNPGDNIAIDGSQFINGNLYVTTSENVFAYQSIGGSASPANQNLFFVPPLNCATPNTVDNIPLIQSIGNINFNGGLNIVTETGALVKINGINITAVAVPIVGNANFVRYTINGLSGNISVKSNKQVYVSYFGTNGAATYGGYYSGFDIKPEIVTDKLSVANTSCIPNVILKISNLYDIFQWYKNDIIISGATSNQYTPSTPGYYQVRGGISGCPSNGFIFSDRIPVSECPTNIDNDKANDNIDVDNDNDGIRNCTESYGNQTIDVSNSSAGNIIIGAYANSFTGATTTTGIDLPKGTFTGNIDGSFITEIPAGKDNSVTYKMTFAKPITVGIEYINTANASDLLNANAEYVINSDVNKTITLLDPDGQLTIDTDFNGSYESVKSEYSSFEIRFKLSSTTPLAPGTGTFKFLMYLANTISFTHKNSSETLPNKSTLRFFAVCVPKDSDNDGVADQLDTDSDNDGILDTIEAQVNNFVTLSNSDTNNNGLDNAFEPGFTPIDTDLDLVPDYLDLDSDNDGILDSIETAIQTDTDGIPNYRDIDSDNDGILDSVETVIDTDLDGKPNYVDVDSDNDGITDSIEAQVNISISISNSDTDKDGLDNAFEPGLTPIDTDSDGIVDYLDIDSDNDGILDSVETRIDSDGDGIPNYRDVDSDNDGIVDTIEAQVNNNIAISNSDTDKDGLDNAFEPGLIPIDTDADGILDYLDLDSDNDGIIDSVETAKDSDGDGIPDYRDLDTDNDSILDAAETAIDTDLDGISNYRDLDSDNDGILDSIETGIDTDSDGTPNYRDLDSDNDLCLDVIEAGFTDGDGDGRYGNSPFTVDLKGLVIGAPYTAPINSNYIISAPIVINTQPKVAPTCELQNVSISLVDNGGNTYQWQLSTDGIIWTDIANNAIYSGATTNTLTLTTVTNSMSSYKYRVQLNKIGNSCGLTSSETTLTVYTLPIVKAIKITQCGTDLSGFSTFNLTVKNNEISTDFSNETFTYYTSLAGANTADATLRIATPISYANTTPFLQPIWARIVNKNGCFRTAQITLQVLATQIPTTFNRAFKLCDDLLDINGANNINNNKRDGVSSFDFSSVTTDIKALLPAGNYSITYYRNQADAFAELNVIADISNYRNIGYPNTQVIWGRVDSDVDNACFGLGPYVTLTVEKLPFANPVTISRQCDDNQDGVYNFNTASLQSTLLGTNQSFPVTVTYFDAANNPLKDSNGVLITSPFPSTFSTNSQIIKVVVTNNTTLKCFDETTIQFIVDDLPEAFAVPISLTSICDNELDPLAQDGKLAFNTSTFHSTILGTQTGMTVKYFDQNGNALPSPLPNPFISGTQNVKVIVENPINTTCFAEITIPFMVDPLPNINLNTNGNDDQLVCSNNPTFFVQLDAGITDASSINDYAYIWSKDGAILSSKIDYTLDVNEEGLYTVEVINTSGCSRTRSIKVTAADVAKIDSIVIVDMSPINTVTVNVSGLGDYEFSIDEPSGYFQDSNFFTDVPAGIHVVYINDKNGCGVVSKTIAIVGVPKFFTPNSDGYNDYWSVKGVNNSFNTNSVIYIFDRYGKLLKQWIPALSEGWDGTFNGSPMPSDDYWYTIKLQDGREVKGNFSLKR